LEGIHPQTLKPPNLAVYKPLPADYRCSDHYFFYGWAITDEILKKHLIKYQIPVDKDPIFAGSCAIRNLEQLSGYHFIRYVNGRVDEEAVAQGRVVPTEDGPALYVLAISCTRSKRIFWRRPTPRQLDRLIEFLGEEPRWIEDFETKENFLKDLMD